MDVSMETIYQDIYSELVEEYGPVVNLAEFIDRVEHGENETDVFREGAR